MRCDLRTGAVETIGQSTYGAFPFAWTPDHVRVFLADQYLLGDVVLYEADGAGGRRMLHGTLLEERLMTCRKSIVGSMGGGRSWTARVLPL